MSFKPLVRSFRSGANVISVRCARVYLDRLRSLLWRTHWRQVEILVEGLEEIGSEFEIDLLDIAAKALKGVAYLAQEPVDQIKLWKRGNDVLSRLMDLGWHVYAGDVADLLVIVLTKQDVASIYADVEWESNPDVRACQIIDDWFDGLRLL